MLDHQIIASEATNCASIYPPVADPNFSNLALWLTGETVTNGSTTLPRDGTLANTYAAHSSRYQTVGTFGSTIETPYPCSNAGNSLFLYGTTATNNIGVNNSTGLNLANSNFTIELWHKFRPVQDWLWSAIFVKGGGNNIAYVEYMLNLQYGVPGRTGPYTFTAYSANSASSYIVGQVPGTEWGVTKPNIWTFISITRNGSSWYMHQDGVLQKTFTSSGTIYNSTRALTVGYRPQNVTGTTVPANKTNLLYGAVKDFKIYKGVAKYSSASYFPPNAPNTPL